MASHIINICPIKCINDCWNALWCKIHSITLGKEHMQILILGDFSHFKFISLVFKLILDNEKNIVTKTKNNNNYNNNTHINLIDICILMYFKTCWYHNTLKRTYCGFSSSALNHWTFFCKHSLRLLNFLNFNVLWWEIGT